MSNQASGTLTKLRASDEAHIWVTNGSTGNQGSVSKLRASDGKVLGTFAVGDNPLGIAFDGENIWVANRL